MRILLLILCGWLVAELCAQTARAQDIVIADFESERYDQWTVTGECFGSGPASGRCRGRCLSMVIVVNAWSTRSSRATRRPARSLPPSFPSNASTLRFSSWWPQRAEISAAVAGRRPVVRSSTGPNDRPGGSETLAQDSWDFAQWKGKRARLRIIDEAQGGWGTSTLTISYRPTRSRLDCSQTSSEPWLPVRST